MRHVHAIAALTQAIAAPTLAWAQGPVPSRGPAPAGEALPLCGPELVARHPCRPSCDEMEVDTRA